MKPSVVITGVSSGFGHATTELLIRRGFHVFGSVRKQADAERLCATFGSEDFTPLLFDVTDAAAIADGVEIVADAVGDEGIAALVNNAGIAGTGPLMHTSLQEMRDAFEVNVFAVLAVTQAFLPLLRSGRKPGRVVNISSTSGAITYPMVGVYSSTKHALESLTDGLRRELSIYGIEVCAIEPGSIRTSIWEKTGRDDEDNRFAGTDYAAVMARMPAVFEEQLRSAKPISVVTNAICHAIEARRPRTRYPLEALWHVRKFMSDRLLDRAIVQKIPLP